MIDRSATRLPLEHIQANAQIFVPNGRDKFLNFFCGLDELELTIDLLGSNRFQIDADLDVESRKDLGNFLQSSLMCVEVLLEGIGWAVGFKFNKTPLGSQFRRQGKNRLDFPHALLERLFARSKINW